MALRRTCFEDWLGGLSWMSQALTFGWLVHSGGDRRVRSRVEHGNAKLDVLKGEVGIAAVHTHCYNTQ